MIWLVKNPGSSKSSQCHAMFYFSQSPVRVSKHMGPSFWERNACGGLFFKFVCNLFEAELREYRKHNSAREMTAFLPPNLLALFAPRDPIPYLAPLDKSSWLKRPWPYSGLALYVREFEVSWRNSLNPGELVSDRIFGINVLISRKREVN